MQPWWAEEKKNSSKKNYKKMQLFQSSLNTTDSTQKPFSKHKVQNDKESFENRAEMI